MINRTSTRRSAEKLTCMLHETANWRVTGPDNAILSEVASLHCAVERAVELGALGRRIVALVRGTPPEIIVFSGQLRNLIDHLFDPDDYLLGQYAVKAWG
jgi:hypothetical protein